MTKVFADSEIAPLKRVIVHRPDEGIARVSPKRAEELLFDDIVHLPRMQEEHDIFTRLLKAFVGKENVLPTEQLLLEALSQDEAAKEEMLDYISEAEELPKQYRKILNDLEDEALADVLVSGYLAQEKHILFDPIPNFIFTRDIAVVVNDHVLITKPAKEARFRENFLTRFIFWAHPLFSGLRAEGKVINLNDVDKFPPSKKREVVALEGGDTMILHKDYLLIGCSERTNAYAIESLKNVLFEKRVVKNVVQVNIPNDRSCMHLDTVFTQINHNHVVGYKPLIHDGLASNVEVHRDYGQTNYFASLRDFIKTELNSNMKFIWSGDGESPYQEREQWTDGCNLVTLRPGVAVTYDRNPKTEAAFKDYGYQIVGAEHLTQQLESGELSPEKVERTIITLPSSELSRARGGSHCMTCPVEREALV
ncbi:MAG: arginine deiminase family protein [Bacteroidota bacterium]